MEMAHHRQQIKRFQLLNFKTKQSLLKFITTYIYQHTCMHLHAYLAFDLMETPIKTANPNTFALFIKIPNNVKKI